MRLTDLINLIFENLGRRKGRVALTAIGVVIGTAAVIILVSLATGLQQNATSQLGGIGDLTQIQVYPKYGDMGGGGMVVQVGPGGKQIPGVEKLITPQTIEELSKISGVTSVIPRDYLQADAHLEYGRMWGYSQIVGIGANDLSILDYKPQSGSMNLEKGTAIIGAMVVRNFNDPKMRPGQEIPPPPDLQDKTVKLVINKYVDDGSGAMQQVRKTIPLRIAGIITESRGESDYSIYMNLDEVTSINEWVNGKRVNRMRDGYNQLIVKVADVDQVLDIAQQIDDAGYQASTPQSYVQGINNYFVIMQIIFGGIGAVALLVAAIGIANTMTMAILERTREIGLMKAVGATNNNVLSVFLGEAAGIGLIGGLGGVLLGWGAGKLLNVVAIAYLAGQASQGGGPPPTSAVYTPLWLPVFALIFATLVGLISGLYPALRAATLVPVTALKYE